MLYRSSYPAPAASRSRGSSSQRRNPWRWLASLSDEREDATNFAAPLLQALMKTYPEFARLGLYFFGEHYFMPPLLQLMQAYALQLVQTSRTSRGLARPEPALSRRALPRCRRILQLLQTSRTSRGLAPLEPVLSWRTLSLCR